MTPTSPATSTETQAPRAAAAEASTCGSCGEPLVAGVAFCEVCGAAAGSDPGPGHGGCERCGGEIDGDGYCTDCGHRALEPVAVDDRGGQAYATHRGRRHARNEDAGALTVTREGWPVLVVADGVSVSPNPDKASAAAVAAAADRLGGAPFAGERDLGLAVEAAHDAARATPATGDPHWTDDGTHPACTIVVAVVTDGAVHVANVGDARAYLLAPATAGEGWAAAQLSTDDSVAALAVAQGIDPDVALSVPGGHAITAWLGADAHDLAPHLATRDAGPGALVLVCSDGLWNYVPTDRAMSELVTAVLPPPTARLDRVGEACERLVTWANEQGGADNTTVALAPMRRALVAGDPPELEGSA